METCKKLLTAFGVLGLVSQALGAGAMKVCSEHEFACLDGQKCIDASRMCDGLTLDCHDESDEFPSICGDCTPSQFACANGKRCISKYWLCDGAMDCADGSDELEKNCGKCTSSEFACANG